MRHHPRYGLLCLVCALPLAAQTVAVDLTAAPGTATVSPGVTVGAWLFNGILPGPVLRVTEGQNLVVRFRNLLPEPTAVHWHGQPVPLGMDGVPGISRPAVAPGQEFRYELRGLRPGSYWFHPHGREPQLDVGLAGVLIVDPADRTRDPVYDAEQVVVLDDWRNPLGGGFTGHLLNGRSSSGQVEIVVQPGQRLRLRLVNAAAVTNYVVALDGHDLVVTHADGNRVQPVRVQAIPLGIGERYDAIVECRNPGVWSLAVAAIANRAVTLVRGVVRYAGQTQQPPAASFVPDNLARGALLAYDQLASYFPVTPITPNPDRILSAALGMSMGSGGMQHTINGQAWPNVTPFVVAHNEQVQLTIFNSGMPMMSDYHPMHVHGHFFRLSNTIGGADHPPLKDTVLVQPIGRPNSSITLQMLIDNPGRWLFHCHNMEHMAGGMMTTFDYAGDSDADGIPDRIDMEPTAAAPVTTLAEDELRFRPGARGEVAVQWTSGRAAVLFLGFAEIDPPLPFPPFGVVHLDPAVTFPFGLSVAAADHRASFAYAIPNDPRLVGVRVGWQALGAAALPGGYRLGPFQAMRIR